MFWPFKSCTIWTDYLVHGRNISKLLQMSWNHFRNFFTPKNALLSGANSPNLNSLERFRCTMPPTVNTNGLTHWGRVTHICVSRLTIIASDNGLSPGRRQAIIWTRAGILLIVPLGTNFSEILIKTITFSFKKMRLKVSSAKWRPCCLGLNVLMLMVRNGQRRKINPFPREPRLYLAN